MLIWELATAAWRGEAPAASHHGVPDAANRKIQSARGSRGEFGGVVGDGAAAGSG